MKVILYTKNFNKTIKEKVDIILSPQFYWIKKLDINIKSKKDGIQIAKNLFKLDDNYLYGSFKFDNKFFIYAIDKNLKLNIDKKYINSIRLAQTELYNFDKINVSKNYSIQKIDELLFCFPYVDDGIEINEVLDKINLSNIKIDIYNSFDKNLIYPIFILFLIINLSLAILIYNNNQAIKNIEYQKSKLILQNNLPKTTFQIDSILNDLKSKDEQQTKLRKLLQIITKTPLKNKEIFTKLSFHQNSFDIQIKTDRNFDFYFKKHFKVSSIQKPNFYKASLYEQ